MQLKVSNLPRDGHSLRKMLKENKIDTVN